MNSLTMHWMGLSELVIALTGEYVIQRSHLSGDSFTA